MNTMLYPNPTKDVLIPKTTRTNNGFISIYDINSKLVKQISTAQKIIKMDMSDLKKGLCLINFEKKYLKY